MLKFAIFAASWPVASKAHWKEHLPAKYAALKKAGRGGITTGIAPAGPFYFAEAYHQAYLAKNPGGYCGIGGTGVTCPTGVGVTAVAGA